MIECKIRNNVVFTSDSNRKVAVLIELFKVVKGLNNFCKMYCKKDGMFIQIMDDAHISLLEIKIKKEWFSTYESEDEVVSFNSKILTTIMGLHTTDSIVSSLNLRTSTYTYHFNKKTKQKRGFKLY